jgi:cell division protein FtsB
LYKGLRLMPATSPASPRRRPDGEPRRRKPVGSSASAPLRARAIKGMLMFAGVVLLVDSLVGERGFLETQRAGQAAQLQTSRLEALRQENDDLRETIRNLKEDPATIEAEARQQLGLIKPGEILFILKDARPADPPPARR